MAKINKVVKVTTRTYNYKQMVERLEPKRRSAPTPGYEFGNNRRFNTPRDPYISAKR